MSVITKNDAWKHIFEKLHLMKKIKDNGYCVITAEEIKKCNPRKKMRKKMRKKINLNQDYYAHKIQKVNGHYFLKRRIFIFFQ